MNSDRHITPSIVEPEDNTLVFQQKKNSSLLL